MRVDRRGRGAIVTLDDGRDATRLTSACLAELARALDALGAADARPAWVLVRGNGRGSFAAGADLAEIGALDALAARRLSRAGQETFARLGRDSPWPTGALVEGHAYGGGFDLALACDLVFAGPGARFCHPGVTRGLVTGWGGTVRLPHVIGPAAARALLLSARELGPEEASRAGLATALPEGDGEAAAEAAMDRIADWPRARLDAWRAARRGAPGALVRALRRLDAASVGTAGAGGS